MKKTYTALLILGITFTACRKKNNTEQLDANQLPPATETGANILACKVNGKAQIYSGVPITLAQNGVEVTRYNSPDGKEQYIEITGSNNKNNGDIKLYLYAQDWHIEVNKIYQFSIENKIGGEYYLINDNSIYYSNNRNNSGYIFFTRYNNVAAGKFSFVAHNNVNDSVRVTEGFFDISVTQ